MKDNRSAIMMLASEVSEVSGVQLGDKQQDMVVQRLRRRMTLLGLKNEAEYIAYYQNNREDEFRELISLFTTHHTYFFREFKHFEILKQQTLPQLIPLVRKRADKTLHLWSAACSRGHEVYSLAIFIELCLKEMAPDLTYQIHGTDIDAISVEFAKNGVFPKKETDSVPLAYQTGNFIRGRGQYSDYTRVHQRIHDRCSFDVANLVDAKTWPKQNFDIIFCRNVFIYFTGNDMEKTARNFQKRLNEGGALFLGLTETLNGLNVNLKLTGPSVYSLPKDKAATPHLSVVPNTVSAPGPAFVASQPKEVVRRVLCVDDSPTILALLKQMFTKADGFTVADTAANGQEALEKIKNNKYDLITLDIHMPIMNGVEFLKNSQNLNRPPVIVISSVDRQEQSLALEALKLGAKDYVEKPSLKTFDSSREEILFKARTLAVENKSTDFNHSLDKVFGGKEIAAKATGQVAVLHAPNDLARAQSYVTSNASALLQNKVLSFQGFLLPLELKTSDAIVVLSLFPSHVLEQIKKTGKKVYLLEDVYGSGKTALIKDFELYPMASLGYAVSRYVREQNDKK
ncbi:CheR family methyltransferase [Pseudobdellovibrio sp. HCB154]|uniref:CheR family methyltransferase n=1 Tax=Pseudobdellovibrio sp. HCB154 TaxID=3386277 RepID=UPI0039176244